MCRKKTGKNFLSFHADQIGESFYCWKSPEARAARKRVARSIAERTKNRRRKETKKGGGDERPKSTHFRSKGESKERAKVYENEVGRGKTRRRETKTKANRVRRKSVQVVCVRERESDRLTCWWEGDGRSVEGIARERGELGRQRAAEAQLKLKHTLNEGAAQSSRRRKDIGGLEAQSLSITVFVRDRD